MFERFTEKAFKVIVLTQTESRRLGHNFMCTEQILIGLIGEETGIAAKVLKSLGVTLNDAEIEVEKIIGRGSGFLAVEIPFTPIAKRALELAEEESALLGHNYVGTEHLLLGTIGVEEGIALRVLKNLGIDATKIRPLVVRMLGENTQVSNASVRSPRGLSDRLRRQDSIAGVEDREIIELLRSIDQNTSEIVQSLNTLNQNMIALCERVEQIEGNLPS